MAAVAATLTGVALRAALDAMGYQRGQVLRITLCATTLFFCLVLLLVPWIGPMGANLAHLAAAILSTASLALTFRHARLEDSPPLLTPVARGDKGAQA